MLLAFGGYYLYNFLTQNSMSSTKAINLVPKDAVYIVETNEPIENWKQISASEPWKYLKNNHFFKGIDQSADALDKMISENEKLFLIHIFEIEWKNKPIQTISMIERYIGIFDEIIPIETLVVKSVEDTIFDEFVQKLCFESS